MHALEIDGTSFEELYTKAPPLIQAIRAGKGPVLIEAKVVRIDPHSSSDDHRKYRSPEDIRDSAERDPLLLMEKRLLATGALNHAGIERLRQEVKAGSRRGGRVGR